MYGHIAYRPLIRRLRWEDFDEVAEVIQVRRQLQRLDIGLAAVDTKTNASRRSLDVPHQVIALVAKRREFQSQDAELLGDAWVNSGFIFTNQFGTPLEPRNVLPDFKILCRKAGLGDWHLHELRHSAASLMLANGVKIQVVSDLLGHASIRMTADVYGHILAPDRKAAAETIKNRLLYD